MLNKKTVQWKRISYSFVSVLLVAALLLPCGVAAVGLELELPEDVSPEDSFYRSVRSGLRFGIIVGTSEDRFIFEPNRIVTRAEFITMLGRMHEYFNEPIATPGEELFYERYLNWAVEMGIVLGDESGYLMPHDPLTREQMMVIADRYLSVFDLWRTVRANFWSRIPLGMLLPEITVFFDEPYVSSWALYSLWSFASIHQLPIDNNRYFRPQDNALRSEALFAIIHIVWLVTNEL